MKSTAKPAVPPLAAAVSVRGKRRTASRSVAAPRSTCVDPVQSGGLQGGRGALEADACGPGIGPQAVLGALADEGLLDGGQLPRRRGHTADGVHGHGLSRTGRGVEEARTTQEQGQEPAHARN